MKITRFIKAITFASTISYISLKCSTQKPQANEILDSKIVQETHVNNKLNNTKNEDVDDYLFDFWQKMPE